ncbi:MAG: beta-eliminating lyase-related protein, partial [Eubacteriales bacterium]|nr:beta-eliminating lyase-related protein [Eubacteriales bacterium]
ENTFALMKVHTSNFRIVGFTSFVSVTELAELAHEHDLPVIEDMGSAFPVRIEGLDAMDLPCAAESLAAGVDIVCFSGDKLLGGPQAGIILGRSRYIDQLKKHPLMRALRVDKMTIAALDTTLALYAEGVAGSKIPVLQMLLASPAQLRLRAERLCKD